MKFWLESQNNFIGEGEDMYDWMWEMEWGISQYGKSIRGHKISFKDDDERSELLSDSLEQILDPSLTYIKGELVDWHKVGLSIRMIISIHYFREVTTTQEYQYNTEPYIKHHGWTIVFYLNKGVQGNTTWVVKDKD